MVKKKVKEQSKKVVKKTKTKKASKKSGKVNKASKENQANIIVIVMISLIVFLIVLMIVASSINNFKYLGIDFTKTKYGEIIVYTAEIPAVDVSGNHRGFLEIDFRHDPRKLRDISNEIEEEGVKFIQTRGVWITIDPKIEECENGGVGVVNLGGVFLKNFELITKLGSLDSEHAEKENIDYITCSDSIQNTVLVIIEGEENRIYKEKENCYVMMFKDCEVSRVTEKFQLQILEDYIDTVDI